MRNASLMIIGCAIINVSAQARPSADEGCIRSDIFAPTATIDLKRAYLDSNGWFVGVFEIVNYDAYQRFRIPLTSKARNPVVSGRTAFVEFKDLNGDWVELVAGRFPGTFIGDYAAEKIVKTGKRFRFRVLLVQRRLLEYAGMEFRLKLYTEKPRLCLVSFPFKAAPQPPRPTGLYSTPHQDPTATRGR